MVRCPLSLSRGSPATQRLMRVSLRRLAEHQDPLWAHTAVRECYPGILEVLQATQNGYPARA